MGHQPSTLNCKINETDKNNQITATQQFVIKDIKSNHKRDQNDYSQKSYTTQNIGVIKSPRNSSTRTNSQKTIFMKSPRQQIKSKFFIPQHECITKVSQFPFKLSIKEKRFYVEQKLKQLGQIIQSRYNSSKHFPYSQILGLTQSLVYSLAYLIKKKCNHHDFYPTNIYYIQNKFKVINPLQLQTSGFYLTSQRQRFSFLSPQLIIAILQQKNENQLGQEIMNKSDVFAIGMILLEMCTLQQSSECYDQESYNIIDSVIKERIAKVTQIYTPIMAECISLMLEYQLESRIEPIILAQLIHLKVQSQKQIAMQMQNSRSPPQQNIPGKVQSPINGQNQKMSPQVQQQLPLHMHSQMQPQMMQRGPPPPPPPYSHQSFKMQNLNPNVIAVSVPNQQFARISPNNQGFLSSSSLQQKLRVIELIKENPNEQDSEGEQQKHRKQVLTQKNIQNNQNIQYPYQQPIQNNNLLKAQTREMPQQSIKMQFPLVESVYTQQSLVQQVPRQYQQLSQQLQPQPQNTNQNVYTSPVQRRVIQLPNSSNNLSQFNQNYIDNNNQNQLQVPQPIKPQPIRVSPPIPRSNFVTSTNLPPVNSNLNVPLVISEPKQIVNSPRYEYNNSPTLYNNLHIQNQQQYQQLHQYIDNNYPKHLSSQTLSYNSKPITPTTINYQQPQQKNNMNMNITSNNYYYEQTTNIKTTTTNNINNKLNNNNQFSRGKYGTATEGQSLQQRVQRVLNMSRNVK